MRTLVQVQRNFEASVKNLVQGFSHLWAELEELHTGVTLSKQEGRGHGDLNSAHSDTQVSTCSRQGHVFNCVCVCVSTLHNALFGPQHLLSVLRDRRDKLKCCQLHLQDSTRLLQVIQKDQSNLVLPAASTQKSDVPQELTWSHAHLSSSVKSSAEAVWAELLLQSNIEQVR